MSDGKNLGFLSLIITLTLARTGRANLTRYYSSSIMGWQVPVVPMPTLAAHSFLWAFPRAPMTHHSTTFPGTVPLGSQGLKQCGCISSDLLVLLPYYLSDSQSSLLADSTLMNMLTC